jgi:class 3 adenylate cyclase
VNVASRLQEACEPGKINVSEAAHEQLAERFRFAYRGVMPLHSFGPTPMYYLLGRK